MTLAAEMQWSLVPTLTVGSERVVVSGMVQPSYEVGDDIFDYALGEKRAHVAIFRRDGPRPGGGAARCSCRGAVSQRAASAAALTPMVAAIDRGARGPFGRGRFVTALTAELELDSGRLVMGHGRPPTSAGAAARAGGEGASRRPDAPRLRPNDNVACRRSCSSRATAWCSTPTGSWRRRTRLPAGASASSVSSSFITRAEAAGEPVPETMRRLGHAVVQLRATTSRTTPLKCYWNGAGSEPESLLAMP